MKNKTMEAEDPSVGSDQDRSFVACQKAAVLSTGGALTDECISLSFTAVTFSSTRRRSVVTW